MPSAMFCQNFDIAIDDSASQGYPVRAASPLFGEALGMLDLDPTARTFLDLLGGKQVIAIQNPRPDNLSSEGVRDVTSQ